MQTPYHTEQRHGLTINIYRDQNCDAPDAWGDDTLFLVGYRRDFWVEGPKKGGRLVVTKAEVINHFTLPQDQEIDEIGEQYHIFPLEAYIHSWVCLALSNEGHFPDRAWDVSQLGACFASKKEFKTRDQARKAVLGLIETWNDALSGNVWGFSITDKEGNDIDSCWGFYGDYDKEGGGVDRSPGHCGPYDQQGANRS